MTSATVTPSNRDFFMPKERHSDETNIAYLQRVIPEIPALEQMQVSDPTYVILVGGRSAYDFRLRVAQSPFRHGLTPSRWSHTAILRWAAPNSLDDAVVLECSLEPACGFGIPTTYNGLQTAYLRRYDNPAFYPNIAVMRVPVDATIWSTDSSPMVTSLLEKFWLRRSVLDVPALLVRWLEYVWSVGNGTNPLLEGWGIPSAAVVDTLISAAGYEMCPGLDTQATSPEAIWQAARWWHPYYERNLQDPIAGFFHYEDGVAFSPSPSAEPDGPGLDLEPNSREPHPDAEKRNQQQG